MKKLLIVFMFVLLFTSVSFAQTLNVKLVWTPSVTLNVDRYIIFKGPSDTLLTQYMTINVTDCTILSNNDLEYTVMGLPNEKVYFALKSLDTNNVESNDLSNIVYADPVITPPEPPEPPTNLRIIERLLSNLHKIQRKT
ncbi:MAG: hypothetical protein R3321_10695, partial [Nitrososphaeraceae archaeon]|nr:hypothetical protein [Nitrososphaeraceae archaeon]